LGIINPNYVDEHALAASASVSKKSEQRFKECAELNVLAARVQTAVY
jgi:hypothetical protein